VLIVGAMGLASNLVGLVLFHDVGHSHGGHSHGHDEHSAAEEGHSHGIDTHDHAHDHAGESSSPAAAAQSPRPRRKSASGKRSHRHTRSQGYSTLDEIYVHPSSFRNSIIESSRLDSGDADTENDSGEDDTQPTEQTSLLSKSNGASNGEAHSHSHSHSHNDRHQGHKHSQPKEQKSGGGHGHSHADLNMRGVFLHVLGDAMGNVGVIATALFIWLTDYSWRFYADPFVSLVITVIILLSALPLCKAASRILLQAVPEHLSIDDIKEDITDLDGIISCHHLHVWQLSDTKLIASLHVQVDFDFKGEGSARYMDLARQVRECLHEYGIHSSTIQPEFCLDKTHDHSAAGSDESSDETAHGGHKHNKIPSVQAQPEACLLECPDSCGNAKQCCDPGIKGCKGNNGSSS
jgi:zinc transporter 1